MSKWADLKIRTLSAIILVAIIIVCIPFTIPFLLLLSAATLIMFKEWQSLNTAHSLAFNLGGLVYIGAFALSMWHLQTLPQFGLQCTQWPGAWVYFTIALVCATDIGAYFFGRFIGGPKLAPRFSPNKTWAGMFGAIICTTAVALLLWPYGWPAALIMGPIVAFIAQSGDMFESYLKRRAGVKDSGKLIPGHGGLLDRVDGLMAVAPFMALYTLLWNQYGAN